MCFSFTLGWNANLVLFTFFFLGNECLGIYDSGPSSCLIFFSNIRYVYDLQSSELRTRYRICDCDWICTIH